MTTREELIELCHDGEEFVSYAIDYPYTAWATRLENIKVKYLGEATKGIKKGVICASFNAG